MDDGGDGTRKLGGKIGGGRSLDETGGDDVDSRVRPREGYKAVVGSWTGQWTSTLGRPRL